LARGTVAKDGSGNIRKSKNKMILIFILELQGGIKKSVLGRDIHEMILTI
jgi:hypothetical protein